jgi:hypothetical protein
MYSEDEMRLVTMTIRVKASTRALLEELARREERTLSDVTRRILETALGQRKEHEHEVVERLGSDAH